MPSSIKVAILEDHQFIVDGYTMRLQNATGVEVVGIAANGEDFESLLHSGKQIDVLIMDVHVPLSDPSSPNIPILSYIPRIRKANPNIHILVISMETNPRLVKSVLEVGANGYIFKSDSDSARRLPAIIKTIASGGKYISDEAFSEVQPANDDLRLTPRQLQVLSITAAFPNLTNDQLALKIGMAHSTFRNMLSETYERLNVHNKVAAIERARSLGMIP